MVENKGLRDGIDKEKIMKSMNKGDWERLRKQKEFEQVDPKTLGYKVLLEADQVRMTKKATLLLIKQRLHDIKNLNTIAKRKKKEVLSGIIKSELKPGVLMTMDEVKLEIDKTELMAYAHAKDMLSDLAKLRGLVGLTDVGKNIILDEKKYEDIVYETKEILAKEGFKLFEDLD